MTTMQFTTVEIERCDRCAVILTEDEKERNRAERVARDWSYDQCFGCQAPAGDLLASMSFAGVRTPDGDASVEWVRRVRLFEEQCYWGTRTHDARVEYWLLHERRITEFQDLAIVTGPDPGYFPGDGPGIG